MKQNIGTLEIISNCLICSGTQFRPFISSKDYTVSNELFHIVECVNCGFKFTNPRPTEESIGKYYQSSEYISHSNTSKGLINSIYQVARRFTISKKVKLIKSITPNGKTILDYGCGTGEFLHAMKETGWVAKGIEPNSEARNFAINKYLLEVFEPSEIMSFPSKLFDSIALWHVLEHIHKLNETIETFRKLLSDKGKLIIAVPNSNSADSKIYKHAWAAYDAPRHLYHFNSDSIFKLFSNHQMKVDKILTMPLDAFYVSMLSEKYLNNSLSFIRGIVNGVSTNIKSLSDKNNSSSLIFILEKN